MKTKSQYKYMTKTIFQFLKSIGGKKYGSTLADLYVKLWNPVNYAMIGGIGVLINYLVWFLFVSFTAMPWFFVNALAIIIAWSWNWANSVGPLGWAWGFKERHGGDK